MNTPDTTTSTARIEANIKSAEAYRAWKAALDINTLGQSDEVAKKAYGKRSAALDEYNKCHAEAFRISEIFNSAYRDMAGIDDHLFINQHQHPNNAHETH